MWVGIVSFIVWLVAVLAATVFIRRPAAYGDGPCREVEGPAVLAALTAGVVASVCFRGAGASVVALFRRSPRARRWCRSS